MSLQCAFQQLVPSNKVASQGKGLQVIIKGRIDWVKGASSSFTDRVLARFISVVSGSRNCLACMNAETPSPKFESGQLSFSGLACRAVEVRSYCQAVNDLVLLWIPVSTISHRMNLASHKPEVCCYYCVVGCIQVLQLALAFRGLNNLQRIMEMDTVALPPYLDSIGKIPQTQLLVQIFFSRHGGLIPFLAQGPRKPEGTQSIFSSAQQASAEFCTCFLSACLPQKSQVSSTALN